MKLITSVHVEHFRSLGALPLDELGRFTSLVGLNSSGKSNVLRALNAFFRGETDAGTPLRIDSDFNLHAPKGKKRRIRVSVTFSLPAEFNFRKGLEPVKALISSGFRLTKEWTRDSPQPHYFLNDDQDALSIGDVALVDQFLSLINFRYIPNRVVPLDIIRAEHKKLRDVLVKRLSPRIANQPEMFSKIQSASQALMADIEDTVKSASPYLDSVRLATPASWQDLVFAFGYKLGLQGKEVDDAAQGSGIQSLLMLATLALIDCDYKNWFGWKQATIWAFEEPESSLHTSLEAKVAAQIAALTAAGPNRLQVICTTHSDLVVQHSDKAFLFELDQGQTKVSASEKVDVLRNGAKLGVSRWVHPILESPLDPLLLVEGKYDCDFLERALHLIFPGNTIRVAYLNTLSDSESGGVDALLQYVKRSKEAISARLASSPIVVLLDWDAAGKKVAFEKAVETGAPYKVCVWPEDATNPGLTKSFRGIERAYPDRIVSAADAKCRNVVGTNAKGKKIIAGGDDTSQFKAKANEIVRTGLGSDDLVHCRELLVSLGTQLNMAV
jgi:AAA domain, putative AbiEii toxin, Type IV TA system